jgi:hypothetical protein
MRAIFILFFSVLSGSLLAQQRAFEILNLERRANEVVLTLADDAEGRTYRVEYSKDLSNASWAVREADRVALEGGRLQLTTAVEEDAVGFFRVQSLSGPSSTANIVISEIMTNNETALEDRAGDFPDWIELWNMGETVADLSGYGLTDNESRLGKWLFPEGTLVEPGGYLVVFASGKEPSDGELHASFSLRNGDEPVIVTTPQGEILDRLDPGALAGDASMGIARDDPDTLYVFEPKRTTPGQVNTNFIFGAPDPYIQVPRFSVSGGVYENTISVALIPADESDVVRYTMDGAEPFHTLFKSNSTLYTEPIVIDKPTVIRAKVMGANPSETVTTTYLVGVSHDLPVLSMVTEGENFDFKDGYLYGMGSAVSANGTVNGSFPYSSSNAWKRDREIEASMEMFEPDGDGGFRQNVGVKIFGGWGSRGYPQKSMAIFARQEYGRGKIQHQLFPDKEVDSFESFVLRNSGNDNQSTWLTHPRSEIRAFSAPVSWGSYFVNCNFTLFRDGMVQSLARETGLDTQGYRPAVLYLNGDYWGIYNIREKLTEHYVESNHGVPNDKVDLIEGYGSANSGSASAYNSMRSYIQNNDMNDPECYKVVEEEHLEIDNFIDYNLTVLWGQNFDIGNIKCWRPQVDDGRFRWLVYDQDYGFNLWKPEVYLPAMKRDFADYENMFTFHTNTSGGGTGWPNASGRTLLLREMLESDFFRDRFILRCADLLNHLWSGDRVVGRIDAMAAVIRGEIPRHLERWSWAAVQERGFGLPHKEEDEPLNLEHWERNVEVMRTFGSGRPEQLRGQLMDHFGFGNGTAEVAVTIQNADKGSVVINTLPVPSEAWSGTYFKDLPISIRAVPNEGATFTGWSGDVSGSELEMMLSLSTADVTIQAVFE